MPPAAPADLTPVRPVWRRHAVPLSVLWCLAALAYANSFRAGLIYDNRFVLMQDSRIRQVTEENVHLILTKDYWYKNSVTSLYRPLTTLSYLFNHAILGNGDAPAGYHAVNLALHAANIALVYLAGWLVLAEFWPAFAMAALWAVHPVLTESVTNVVGRADLLAAFGVLAGLLCYARSVAAVGRQAILWQAGVLAASTVAMFSKESGIVIIAVIFLYDIAWLRQTPLSARIGGYLAAALPIAIFLAVRAEVLKDTPLEVAAFTDNPLTGAGFWTARLTAMKVLGKYLWLLFWPARLSCDYSYNQIPLFSWNFGRWEDWQTLISLAVYAVAAALAVWSYRRARPVFFLIGFFFAAMAPTANLFLLIGTIMAERLLYLPSVAFAGCLAWGGWNLYQRLQPRWPAAGVAAPALLTIVCLALGGRTFARNFDWYDEGTLWTSAERVCPQSYRPHQHVANWLANPPAKDFDTAERKAEQAIAILQPLPDVDQVPFVYATAGFCYRARGDELAPNGAVWYRKALDVLLEGVKVDEAGDREFRRLNTLAGKTAGPSHVVPLYLELARTYRGLGQYRNAIDALTTATWADPQAEFFEELSKIYQAEGDAPQAVVSLMEGITMGITDQVRLAGEVVDLYKQTAPQSCALAGSGAGAAINFGCPMVHEQLCLASRNVAILYHRMQRDRDAAATAAGAVSSLGCPAEMFR
jgi:tetratricopeptide (TPR) repeat protein